ncbi:MAG: hypothetical protein R3352_00325 [Salinisphaeraceae bacterium]|nr:hypothetical protein [Salinisphaeraceae bacterium]
MDWVLILLTLACFAGGILLSRWQTRRQYRAHVAERLAREVEKEIARRAVEKFAQQEGQSTGTKSTGDESSKTS